MKATVGVQDTSNPATIAASTLSSRFRLFRFSFIVLTFPALSLCGRYAYLYYQTQTEHYGYLGSLLLAYLIGASMVLFAFEWVFRRRTELGY